LVNLKHIILKGSILDARALVRLQADHVNRILLPAFYRFLQAQDTEAQITTGKEFHEAIEMLIGLFERAEREMVGGNGVSGEGERQALSKGLGLWVDGGELGWTDVMVAPCGSFDSALLGTINANICDRDVPSTACIEALQRL
jgi:hypothetical protein